MADDVDVHVMAVFWVGVTVLVKHGYDIFCRAGRVFRFEERILVGGGVRVATAGPRVVFGCVCEVVSGLFFVLYYRLLCEFD